MSSARAILYHKQSTSAMTRFFRLDAGGVCLGRPGPNPAIAGARVVVHPASVAAELERWMGLPSGGLLVDAAYQEHMDVAGLSLPVYLMRFTTMDPPFTAAEAVGGSFITLTQARGLGSTELELLRTAYTMIMEG
ncbi:MAG: hypothetical protein AUK36_05655 [Zetaproteobacteria bacterium CG2_30_59_37]|nr:MAG: hypothetical protein AUK36_05655 [Zetaproteobacteria bacterium CG2_30_59_37]